MSVYAQLEDLEAWTGAPIRPEQAHDIQQLLNEAEVELAVVAGDLTARVVVGLTTPERVLTAVVGMVGRVIRDRVEAQRLLSGTSTGEERSSLRRWLSVTRRERSLLGLSATAGSVSLAAADPQLRWPVVEPLISQRGYR